MEDIPGKFDAIRGYFKNDSWNELSDYEKRAFCNIKENYDKMKEVGIAGQTPSFMRSAPAPAPRPARPRRPHAEPPDSGDDWSPSRCVQPAQRRTSSTVRRGTARKKGKLQPPVKKTTTETADTSAGRRSLSAKDQSVVDKDQSETEEEKEVQRRPPSPPYDFIGFTLEDQYKARHVVDTKAERLWTHVIAGSKAIGEASPEREVFKRRRTVVNYKEEFDLDDDCIFCDECDREWEGGCPVHGPLDNIPDAKVPFGAGDPQRAVKTLPEFLNPGRSKIPGAHTGIWTEKDLPARQRFGPYEGTIVSGRRRAPSSGYSWKIKKDYRSHHYVDAGDSSCSNWLRLVNCARFEQEQNLIAFQCKGQMYYRTCKAVRKGTELLVYYGDADAKELNINVRTFKEAPAAAPPGTSFSGGNTVNCIHCDYACLGQDRLDRHVKQRHSHIDRDGRFKCGWCNYSTDNSGNMIRHRRLTHPAERAYRCDDCGETFAEQGALTRHRHTHTGQRQHVCDVCERGFTQAGRLRTHKRIHTGEFGQCEQCGATFVSVSNYVKHMNADNCGKAHRCDVCLARFTTRQHLTTHMRTHTGERPYACSFCPARFANQSYVKRHVIARHTHDYKHRCGRCNKGFVKPGVLRKHEGKCSGAE